MHRSELGSSFFWLKTLAAGFYGFAEWWPGFARTPREKAVWAVILIAFVLWGCTELIGYVDDWGIHYRNLIRFNHVPWHEVQQAEWDAAEMVLRFTVGTTRLRFKYRGIAPLFGGRQRPEAVNFAERMLTTAGSRERFVCKTSLTAA